MGIQARKIREEKKQCGRLKSKNEATTSTSIMDIMISWEFDLSKWCWPSQKLWANCDSQLGLLISKKQLRNTCQNSIHTIQNWNMVWWPERISDDALQTCTNKLQNSPHLQFGTGIPPIMFNPDQKMPAKSGCWSHWFSRSVSSSWNPEFCSTKWVIEKKVPKSNVKKTFSVCTHEAPVIFVEPCWSQKISQPVWLPGLLKSWTPVFCWSHFKIPMSMESP